MKDCTKDCNTEMLCRFFDKETGPDESALVEEHLGKCPACKKVLREHQEVSRVFTATIGHEVARANLRNMEAGVLSLVARRRSPWWPRLAQFLLSKRMIVPATAVAAGIFLFSVLLQPPASAPGPSAIISSLGGNGGAVMILETPKSHQTIIWFTEPATLHKQSDGTRDEESAVLPDTSRSVFMV